MKIIFVCHGSICRSPAAEMLFRQEAERRGVSSLFEVSSKALSSEEISNPIYPPMKRELIKQKVKLYPHESYWLTQKELDDCDYLFYMDYENKRRLERYFHNLSKCLPVFYFSPGIVEIEDPWYSGNYSLVVEELRQCVKDILDNILK